MKLRSAPLATALATALLLSGCATLVPALPEAQPQVPQGWPMPERTTVANDGIAVADVGWREVLVDPRLQRVVAQALDNNRDLRVTIFNVERARAQYQIRRADRVPSVGGSVGAERVGGDVPSSTTYNAGVGIASYELDLFGRVRNLSEAALQQYFAQGENRRAAQVSLIAAVSNTWLDLAAVESLKAIAESTLKTYEEALRLSERRHEIGVISGLELAQARTQVETARADVARYAGQVQLGRNALNLLAGAPVGAADLPTAFDAQTVAMVPLPANLSSEVLLRRPDIQAAEHVLVGANANIGAARAAFFPSISLTGNAGTASSSFSGLFESGSLVWRFLPQINLPIFQGGRLRANLGMATADRDIALANYEKAIQTGFREVADGLALAQTLAEGREAAERLLAAAQRAEMLSAARYAAGRDSYLVRLDAQRTLYQAQQALLQSRLAEQLNRVALYRAFGGGWQVEPASVPASSTTP